MPGPDHRPGGKAVRKYLERHAGPEARAADGLPPGEYGQVVVLPVYGEGDSLFAALHSIPSGPRGDTLVLLVLNARADAPADRHAANAAVRRRFPAGTLHEISAGRRLWLIDRAGEGRYLPGKEGVGLARKIGCDVAFVLWTQGRLKSRFIHWTDADAVLPRDYFERVEIVQEDRPASRCKDGRADPDRPFGDRITAIVYPFEHIPESDPVAARAIRLYESFLRYYVLGLRHAGSPYAFHSIGSTLAIDAAAYAEVRGVPRVMAGEDFYCLNKLAKLGVVRRLEGEPILLSGRVSDRVPFGTGRAMTELVASRVAPAQYSLPDPEVFDRLGTWLRLVRLVAAEPPRGQEPAARQWIQEHVRPPDAAQALERALESTGAFALLEEAVRDPLDERTRYRRLCTAFDGFRTLKLLHALRDLAYPPRPFFAALARAGWIRPAIHLPEDDSGDLDGAVAFALSTLAHQETDEFVASAGAGIAAAAGSAAAAPAPAPAASAAPSRSAPR